MDTAEKNQMMFVQLVSMFQAAALQQMGKLKNPVTEKIERNMEQAQLSIDLIDMLKEKTKGNRSAGRRTVSQRRASGSKIELC